MKENKQKLQKKLSQRINNFIDLDNNKSGSKKRLLNLIDNFQNNSRSFLIAGSWAIEIISKEKIKHDDIDIIIFDEQEPIYLDDAKYTEEKCHSKIPLEKEYFKENNFECDFENRFILVPSLNLQICLKLIGQLQEKLPERAIKQLKLLLESYKHFDEKRSQKEIDYILKKLLPDELNFTKITTNIISALKIYNQGKKELAIEEFIRLHSLINKSLRYQFEKRGLTKKIKISNK